LRQQIIEQNHVGRYLPDLPALGIERILCSRDQQTDNKRGHGGNEADPEPNHVLGVLVEVMPWQGIAKQAAEKDAAYRQQEYARR
jgi:hypothetical protein